MFKEFLSECYSDTDYDVTVKTEIRTYLDGYAFYVIIDYDSREEDPDCCSYYTEYYFCGDEQLKKRYDYTLNDIEDDVWCSIYGLLEELKKRTVVYSPNLKAKSLEAFRCLDGYMITEKEEVDFFLQSKYLEMAKCPREFSGDLVTTKKYYEIPMNTIPATEYKEFPGSGKMKLYIRKELAKYADSIIYKRLYEKLVAQ